MASAAAIFRNMEAGIIGNRYFGLMLSAKQRSALQAAIGCTSPVDEAVKRWGSNCRTSDRRRSSPGRWLRDQLLSIFTRRTWPVQFCTHLYQLILLHQPKSIIWIGPAHSGLYIIVKACNENCQVHLLSGTADHMNSPRLSECASCFRNAKYHSSTEELLCSFGKRQADLLIVDDKSALKEAELIKLEELVQYRGVILLHNRRTIWGPECSKSDTYQYLSNPWSGYSSAVMRYRFDHLLVAIRLH